MKLNSDFLAISSNYYFIYFSFNRGKLLKAKL
jgi:hypothetical protein